MSFLKNLFKASTASSSSSSIQNIYQFTAKDINGVEQSLSKYKNNVCIILNVACKCGFTQPNYTQLQQLYAKYKDQGLRVLAFPCNQFGGQEPGSENEIKEFVKKYNVQFDMFSKIDVNGSRAHPLFEYLKHTCGGTLGDSIKWNFTKFLVNKNGVPVKRYAPNVNPVDIEQEIMRLLKE